jgi:hypothetical protein
MVEQEVLGYDEQADELLLMGLRLKEGIDLVRWQDLSGREPDPDREQFLIEHGFIERLGNSRLRCTPAGMLILDSRWLPISPANWRFAFSPERTGAHRWPQGRPRSSPCLSDAWSAIARRERRHRAGWR